jgi:hypothetical protein
MRQQTQYRWQSAGEINNPVIAYIAPSNLISQDIIQKRIDMLVRNGFCVKYPVYDDQLLAPKELDGRKSGGRMGDQVSSPAVNIQDGANQVIDCIVNGWNIMPLMGGDSFEQKLPLIIKYFEEHPEHKNPRVKFFGLSNATFAAFLQASGICRFIATPFLSAITRSDEGQQQYQKAAQELLKIMREESTESHSRPILFEPSNQLSKIYKTTHYVLNVGPICADIKDDYKDLGLSLKIPDGQKWSMAFEGFIENGSGIRLVNYHHLIREFLIQHKDNLPQFIEIGNIATRLDGVEGYQNLHHDQNGLIELSDQNINKILKDEEKLRNYVKKIIALQDKGDIPQDKKTPFPAIILQKVSHGETLDSGDIVQIIEQENSRIKFIQAEVIRASEEFGISLILNNRYGHTDNMAVVDGGFSSVLRVKDGLKMVMLEPTLASDISKQSGKPVQQEFLQK